MLRSKDPVHDISHAERVAALAQNLSEDYDLDEKQKNAILLAAWWHDVGRTITNSPSLIFLSMVDDTISGVMLLLTAIRYRLNNETTILAAKIIMCKNMGTGALFTKIFLKKKDRFLVDIVEDADNLDTINPDRMKKIISLAELSFVYHFGYRIMIWWYFEKNNLKMRTKKAKKLIFGSSKLLFSWLQQKNILSWHVRHFGWQWSNQKIKLCRSFVRRAKKTLV